MSDVGTAARLSGGGGFVTTSWTGTLNGLLAAPADVMEILLLYVPAASPEMFTETVNTCGVVPLAGPTEIQAAPSVAADTARLGEAVIWNVWDRGAALPIS